MSRAGRIVIGSPQRGEVTNVGIVIFNKDGNYACHRIITDIGRVKRREEVWINATDSYWRLYLDKFAIRYPTWRQWEAYHQNSIGNAMSCVQLIDAGSGSLEPEMALESAWKFWIREA